jgi:hypothetical protein
MEGFRRLKRKMLYMHSRASFSLTRWYKGPLCGHHYFCIQDPKYKNAGDQLEEALKSNLRLHPGYFLHPSRNEESSLLKEAIAWLKNNDNTKADKADDDKARQEL